MLVRWTVVLSRYLDTCGNMSLMIPYFCLFNLFVFINLCYFISTNPSLKPSVKPHPQNEFPQSDQSNKQATKDIRPLQQAVTAHDACIEHNMTTKNHQETDVPLLSLLYSVADVSTLNEAIVVALHSFMLECGFRCSPNMEVCFSSSKFTSCISFCVLSLLFSLFVCLMVGNSRVYIRWHIGILYVCQQLVA